MVELPPFSEVREALLGYLADKGQTRPIEVYGPLAEQLTLSAQWKKDGPNPSETRWDIRVRQARRALKNDGLVSARLGVWELTPEGLSAARVR